MWQCIASPLTGQSVNAIKIGRWRFEPKLWPSLAAAAFVLLTFSLGEWQTRRAQEKLELQARIDDLAAGPAVALPARAVEASEFAQRAIEVHGEFLAEKTIFIDNRVYRMQPGYHVMTPLRISGGNIHVVINRGWIAADPRREVLPRVDTPVGEQVLQGIGVIPPEHVYQLAPDTASGPVKQNLVLGRLREQWGIVLQPVVMLQTSGAADSLVRDWPRPDAGANTNLAYALQWYVMAAVGAVLWLTLNLNKADETG
jgi:surfeit locus 1 family protein